MELTAELQNVFHALRNDWQDNSGKNQLEALGEEISASRKQQKFDLFYSYGDSLAKIDSYFFQITPAEIQKLIDFIQYAELDVYPPLNKRFEEFVNEQMLDGKNKDTWLKIAHLTRYIIERNSNFKSLNDLKDLLEFQKYCWWIWGDCIADLKTPESSQFLMSEIPKKLKQDRQELGLLLMRIPGWRESSVINNIEMYVLLLNVMNTINDDEVSLKIRKWIDRFEINPTDSIEHFPPHPKFRQNKTYTNHHRRIGIPRKTRKAKKQILLPNRH